jgi:deoxyribodipyrimidine photolyase-related protein
MKIGFIFPHQLYENNPFIEECDEVYIIEEDLFFKQFNFHKQKIAFHRASMKFYESCLLNNIVKVIYIESKNKLSDVRKLIHYLKENSAIIY